MRYSILLIVVSLLIALSTPRAPLAQVGEKGSVTLPFELYQNHIYLPVRVNNSPPFSFVLDSGAGVSVFSIAQASVIGLKTSGQVNVTGTGSATSKATFASNLEFVLPGLTFLSKDVAVLSLDELLPYEGRRIDGILGYDFFKSFVVEIDYAARRVHLHDATKYRYTGTGQTLPISFVSNHPCVRMSITLPGGETVAGIFIIDTGSRQSVLFGRPFARSQKLLKKLKTVEGFGTGLGGESAQRVGRVPALHLRGITIENPTVTLFQVEGGALSNDNIQGVIGGELLRRFTLIFDYSRRQLHLEPNAHLSAPFEYDMSGMVVVAEGADYRTIRIKRVFAGTPAAASGLRIGDEIIEVDGQASSHFTLDTLRQLLRQPDHSYQLKVKRGGEVISAVLRTRRLI